MKKNVFFALLATLCMTVTAAGAIIFSGDTTFKLGATDVYTCALPSGYREISDVVDYLNDGHDGMANPYTFRGTVTRRDDDEFFVQRVNQTTFKLDAIKVVGASTYANSINEGNVVDISGGQLFLDEGYQPSLRLTASDDLFKSFDVNPTGYEPKQYQTFDEWLMLEDFSDHNSYVYSRLITIKKAKPISYQDVVIGTETYKILTVKDLINNQDFNVLLKTEDNSEVISTFEDAVSQTKAISITSVFTRLAGYSLFLSTKVSDIEINGSYLDSDLIKQTLTPTIYYNYNDEYSYPIGYSAVAYYLEGKADIPYVNFSEFALYILGYLYTDQILNFYEAVDYDKDEYYFYSSYLGIDNFCYVLDPVEDTFTVFNDTYSVVNPFDTDQNGSRYYIDGIETGLCKIDSEKSKVLNAPSQISFDFSEYNIDLVIDKYDNIYMPMTLMANIMDIEKGVTFAFNGQDLYSMSSVTSSQGLFDYYYSTSPNLNNATRTATAAEYNYNELAFMVDHFYGLRDTIIPMNTNFYDLVRSMGLEENLLSTDTYIYETALADIVCMKISDGHARYLYSSPAVRNDINHFIYDVGRNYAGGRNDRVKKLFDDFDEIDALREQSGKKVGLEIVDNVAIIRFDSFVKYYVWDNGYLPDASSFLDLNAYTYEDLHELGSDLLFRKAFDDITEYNDDPANLVKIDKVVVDIADNGGGMMDSLPFLEAYFTSDPSITICNDLSGEIVETHFSLDLDFDGTFGDTYAGQFDFFLLESNVSFSCGNYFPTVIKEKGAMTIIGETSGGGECSVGLYSTFSGALLRDSSNYHMGHYDYVNDEFVGNDHGIVPDFEYPRAKFYDTTYLVNFVNAL